MFASLPPLFVSSSVLLSFFFSFSLFPGKQIASKGSKWGSERKKGERSERKEKGKNFSLTLSLSLSQTLSSTIALFCSLLFSSCRLLVAFLLLAVVVVVVVAYYQLDLYYAHIIRRLRLWLRLLLPWVLNECGIQPTAHWCGKMAFFPLYLRCVGMCRFQWYSFWFCAPFFLLRSITLFAYSPIIIIRFVIR